MINYLRTHWRLAICIRAFSTNRTAQMFHLAKNKRIEVYDDESDVFVYDTESQTIIRDTLTMKEAWAENCPAFSHDDKWLLDSYNTPMFKNKLTNKKI